MIRSISYLGRLCQAAIQSSASGTDALQGIAVNGWRLAQTPYSRGRVRP